MRRFVAFMPMPDNKIVLYFGKTISGVPGNVFTFFLYLKPRENKYFRKIISEVVSLPFTQDIISERFAYGIGHITQLLLRLVNARYFWHEFF